MTGLEKINGRMKPVMILEPRKVKAVIFDVYHTLLAVADGPSDAGARWCGWWKHFVREVPPPALADFDRQCRRLVDLELAGRRAGGIPFPEVDWPAIVCRAAPELSGLGPGRLDEFLSGHAALQRTAPAMPGAPVFLEALRRRGILTGIASNAQRYTWSELEAAGIPVAGFEPDLCFWSFVHGFSKPDPGVLILLTDRLAVRGIGPEETLMIGDRLDNDILPARAMGWQAWHFQGDWPDL